MFDDCVVGLGDNPTQDQIDMCEADTNAAEDACRALCPDDNDDADGGECRNACEADATLAFEACVALLGDNPTEDEIDVCEDDARALRNACDLTCPIDCDDLCRMDARQAFEACLDALGADATDDEEDACKDEARALRDTCRANCNGQPLMKQHRGTGRATGS